MEHATSHDIWENAPNEAYHWERLPSGCVWHCRIGGKTFSKEAPNFEIKQNFVWRDADMQQQADRVNASIKQKLNALNITLA